MAVIDQQLIANSERTRRYVETRPSAGPLIGREKRSLQLAACPAGIGDHRIGRTQHGGRYAVLERRNTSQGGVIHTDDLKRLKCAIWELYLCGTKRHRDGPAHPFDTAHAIER